MKNIPPIADQKVSPELRARARELRQQMTPQEKRLWEKLRANRLEGWLFRRQQIITNFIVDFYCHAAGLIIEVDGPIHLAQKKQDAARGEFLESCGYQVLRFTNEQIDDDIGFVLAEIQRHLT